MHDPQGLRGSTPPPVWEAKFHRHFLPESGLSENFFTLEFFQSIRVNNQ